MMSVTYGSKSKRYVQQRDEWLRSLQVKLTPIVEKLLREFEQQAQAQTAKLSVDIAQLREQIAKRLLREVDRDRLTREQFHSEQNTRLFGFNIPGELKIFLTGNLTMTGSILRSGKHSTSNTLANSPSR